MRVAVRGNVATDLSDVRAVGYSRRIARCVAVTRARFLDDMGANALDLPQAGHHRLGSWAP